MRFGRLVHDRAELGVLAVLVEQLARALEVVAELPPLHRELVSVAQAPVLASDLRVASLVRDHGRVGHLALQLGKAPFDLFYEALDHGQLSLADRA